MKCSQFLELASEFLDKNLDNELHEQVNSHLSQCESCHTHLKSLKDVISRLKNLPEIDPPEGLLNEIHSRLDTLDENRSVPFIQKISPYVGGFATLAAGFAVILLLNSDSKNFQMPHSVENIQAPVVKMDSRLQGDSESGSSYFKTPVEDKASPESMQREMSLDGERQKNNSFLAKNAQKAKEKNTSKGFAADSVFSTPKSAASLSKDSESLERESRANVKKVLTKGRSLGLVSKDFGKPDELLELRKSVPARRRKGGISKGLAQMDEVPAFQASRIQPTEALEAISSLHEAHEEQDQGGRALEFYSASPNSQSPAALAMEKSSDQVGSPEQESLSIITLQDTVAPVTSIDSKQLSSKLEKHYLISKRGVRAILRLLNEKGIYEEKGKPESGRSLGFIRQSFVVMKFKVPCGKVDCLGLLNKMKSIPGFRPLSMVTPFHEGEESWIFQIQE